MKRFITAEGQHVYFLALSRDTMLRGGALAEAEAEAEAVGSKTVLTVINSEHDCSQQVDTRMTIKQQKGWPIYSMTLFFSHTCQA